jgi:tRNA A37 methylthiotransferase MiaB
MAVLWEQETEEEEVWSGLTDNYIRVFTKSSQRLENRLVEARITDWRNGDLWGELCIGKPLSALRL